VASVADYSECAVEPAIPSVSAATLRTPLGVYRFLLALIVFDVRCNAFDFTNGSTGYVVVICFFVVSGSIIARVLDTIYVGPRLAPRDQLTLRIYPVMWAATIISLAAIAIHGNFVAGHNSWEG
jgi:peptidoglycan/LPS O-acetylase OafA/YrhL